MDGGDVSRGSMDDNGDGDGDGDGGCHSSDGGDDGSGDGDCGLYAPCVSVTACTCTPLCTAVTVEGGGLVPGTRRVALAVNISRSRRRSR